jgi:hypothetical protein
MPPFELLALLRARPFRPFRIVMTEGQGYLVRHPENVIVTPASAHVGYPDEKEPAMSLRVDIISLAQVRALELIEQPAQKPGDGQG